MRIIVKFLVVALISAMTSGVFAQTSKTNDVAKMPEHIVSHLKKVISANKNMLSEDSAMVVMLLNRNNLPLEYVIEKKGEIVEQSQIGDKLTVYISYQRGDCYWLSYVVSRNDKFIGRLDVRLD